MKITSPITCPADFGPVEFNPRDDRRSDVFAVTVDGEELAELAPLTFSAAELLTEQHLAEAADDSAGWWSLTPTGSCEEPFGTSILYQTGAGETAGELTGEMAVWATLVVLWARDGSIVARG